MIVCKLWRNLGRVRLILSSATRPIDGSTACKWDTVIPFPPMWAGIKHVRKERAAVVMFGSEPFSSLLRVSNLKEFKYDWIWVKNRPSNLHHARNMPMLKSENISVFSSASMGHASLIDIRMNYYPQNVINTGKKKTVKEKGFHGNHIGKRPNQIGRKYDVYTHFPHNVLFFKKEETHIHPTQKPVTLLEYLIKTYTLEGDTVLDFTMGSGSTGVAAMRTGRKFIGIEQDAEYFEIAQQRIANAAGDYVTTEAEKATGQIALWDMT